VQIGVLGPLEVRTDAGAVLDVGGARLRALLIRLALDAGRVVTTRQLVDGLWGDDQPAAAGNALQALVSRLRRALPAVVVESHPAGYRLVLDPDAVDAHRFARLAAAGHQRLATDPAAAAATLCEALALWRGPALADVADAEFARATIARLDEQRLAARQDRVEADLRRDAGPGLVAELEELVAAYPLREPLVGQLMRALAAAGRPNDALAVYEQARTRLADELGTDPSPELAALHLDLLRAEPPPPPGIATPTNLRAGITTFVGRGDEAARVGKLLDEARLTTLIGPGGAGKTRLAVEAARGLLDRAPDGVWLVELASITDPGEVAQAIVHALDVREQWLMAGRRGGPDGNLSPLVRLVAALSGKRVLLVLDNCEHLLDGAAAVADRLLGECPDLRVLATSREPLGITGETLWPVEPLALPPPDADADTAARYPAVRLLADRAAAVRSGFAVRPDNAAAVVRICRALDGMPLAIELAAARLRSMTAEQVAARLDDRFGLLTAGSRTALPRHRTLQAVVDWSWDLLDPAERALWRRFAVFQGGAGAEAAARVCGSGEVDPALAPDLLAALVDKSLLVAAGEGEPRYRMLETIREYGLRRLDEAGERDALRRRHAAYFLELAEAAERRMRGHDQLEWLARLDEDRDNLHVALRGAVAARDAATAVRLAGVLGWYWWLRGQRLEGAELAAEAVTLADEAPAGVPAEAMGLAATTLALNTLDGALDIDGALRWFRKATTYAGPDATHPLLRLIGPAEVVFGALGGEDPDMAPLREVYEHDPDPWARAAARVIHTFAAINLAREPLTVEAECRTALAAFREIGDRWGMSMSLLALSELTSRRGEYAAAAECLREAAVHVTALGTYGDAVQADARRAACLWALGQVDEARELLSEAGRTAERLGTPEALCTVEFWQGELCRLEGDTGQARTLLTRAAGRLTDTRVAPQSHAITATSLAYLDSAAGDLAGARAHLTTALDAAMSASDAPVVGQVLVSVADYARRAGRPGTAAALLGAAEGIRGMPDRSVADLPRVEAAVRDALGADGYAEAFARGRTTTVHTLRDLVGEVL
jgi:predicted ATPase/DNA-binding SARP family transcriptional activator